MKRLYCNYAESMSHGLAFIFFFFLEIQLQNAKNIFKFTLLLNLLYEGFTVIIVSCLGCSGLPA